MLWLRLLGLSFFLFGCQPSASNLLETAEKESLRQRDQLAQHLFLQVIRTTTPEDRIRWRALLGLAELCFNQLHDYKLGVQMVQQARKEAGSDLGIQARLRNLSFRASQAARLHLQQPILAREILSPYLSFPDLTSEELLEAARVEMALRKHENAASWLKLAWTQAEVEKSCTLLRTVQLELMQTSILLKDCPQAIEWGKREQLFAGCSSDRYAVRLDLAHCYEFEGYPEKAISIYETLLKENPQNTRLQFLLANVLKRQKEKQIR